MKTYFIPIIAAAFLISCGEENKPEGSMELAEERNDEKFDVMEKDAQFMVDAANDGMMEIWLADLALQKSSNSEVKALATQTKADHEAAGAELTAMASQKNVSIPVTFSDELKKNHKNLVDETGADFDRDYMDLMVKHHKDAVKMFEKQSTDGSDADIKSWAASKVPTLRNHLEMAENTKANVK